MSRLSYIQNNDFLYVTSLLDLENDNFLHAINTSNTSMNTTSISLLPPKAELESRSVLRSLTRAHRYLAELKGLAATIPNEQILIDTLSLQEAKDSSEIENVITTQDDLYKANLFENHIKNPAAKQVSRYAATLKIAFNEVKTDRLLTVNRFIDIQAALEQSDAGFRKLPGTTLKNGLTGETVYTPPSPPQIIHLMNNLEKYINDESMSNSVDHLVKMAIVHHQFESIHPFYDGNGRTGRIINILYLVAKGLLDIPVLYLSRYIIRNKLQYYRLLQSTRESGNWEPWILYMLKGVELTSRQTIWIIHKIKDLMMQYKHGIRTRLPKVYSQDLINNLFRHPYTKIEFVQNDLGVSRPTAVKYLALLAENGFVDKYRFWRHNYYVNQPLFSVFANIPEMDEETFTSSTDSFRA